MGRDTEHPAPSQVVDFFRNRIPDLCGAPRLHMKLPIPPRSFLCLITFLHTCRQKQSRAASADPEVLQDAAPGLPLDQLREMPFLISTSDDICKTSSEGMNEVVNRKRWLCLQTLEGLLQGGHSRGSVKSCRMGLLAFLD